MKKLIDLYCDICGAQMTMERINPEMASFNCTKCEQNHVFGETIGGHTCVILKYLWPNNTKESSKMYRNEYIPAWKDEHLFNIKAQYLAGLIKKKDYDNKVNIINNTVNDWYKNHPIKRWWQIFK